MLFNILRLLFFCALLMVQEFLFLRTSLSMSRSTNIVVFAGISKEQVSELPLLKLIFCLISDCWLTRNSGLCATGWLNRCSKAPVCLPIALSTGVACSPKPVPNPCLLRSRHAQTGHLGAQRLVACKNFLNILIVF